METPELIRASLIPGEWVSLIDISDTYLHIPIHQNSKEVPTVLPQFSGVPVHPPPSRPSHGPTSLYNDCKGNEADGRHKVSQTSPISGCLADQGPVPGGGTSEHTYHGRSDTVLRVDNVMKGVDLHPKDHSI